MQGLNKVSVREEVKSVCFFQQKIKHFKLKADSHSTYISHTNSSGHKISIVPLQANSCCGDSNFSTKPRQTNRGRGWSEHEAPASSPFSARKSDDQPLGSVVPSVYCKKLQPLPKHLQGMNLIICLLRNKPRNVRVLLHVTKKLVLEWEEPRQSAAEHWQKDVHTSVPPRQQGWLLAQLPEGCQEKKIWVWQPLSTANHCH